MLTDDLCLTCGHRYHDGRCGADELIASCNCDVKDAGCDSYRVPCWCVKEAP
jgi:hypothetical protein